MDDLMEMKRCDIHQLGQENNLCLAADALSYFFDGDKDYNVFHGNNFYRYGHTEDRSAGDRIHIEISEFLLCEEYEVHMLIETGENPQRLIEIMKIVEDMINKNL